MPVRLLKAGSAQYSSEGGHYTLVFLAYDSLLQTSLLIRRTYLGIVRGLCAMEFGNYALYFQRGRG